MAYAYKKDDVWTPIEDDIVIDGTTYEHDTIYNSSLDDLEALGIKTIIDGEPDSPGTRVGRHLEDRDGIPTWIYEIVPYVDVNNETRLATEVNGERDRRIIRGFFFNGKIFDSKPEDQKRISGAFSLALAAVISGAKAGDYLWHRPEDGKTPFGFISQDNTIVLMDAQTVMGFGTVAAKWESSHIFSARQLKDMSPIPTDYSLDKYWPAFLPPAVNPSK